MTGFQDIILSSGARTPLGDFGKSLRDTPLTTLSVHAVQASLQRAGITAKDVDHLVYGNTAPVDHDGLFASRKIAIDAGMPIESSAMGVTRACGTGSQAIVTAAQQIASGHSHVALAAGGENYSRVPYLAHQVRWGAQRGPFEFVDGLDYIYLRPVTRLAPRDCA